MREPGWFTVERPPLASVAGHPRYRWMVVGTVCIGAFLGQLDASIAGLVLPTLEQVFQAPVSAVEWVAISYLLTLAALVVPLGRLADLTGRKMLYTFGFLVFIIGSALCGLAPTLGFLIAARVAQAVGAAMLQANSVAIITAAVPRRSLGRAIGIQGAAQAIGLAVGPSVGGFLIDSFGWEWVFFIAVPFGLLGTLIGWLVLPVTPARITSPSAPRERFDWPGAVILGPAIALLLIALTFGNTWGWLSPTLVGVLGGAVALVITFLVTEKRAASPLVDLRVFRDRTFSLAILSGLLSYAVLFGSLFLFPFYLERVAGQSPGQTGLLLTPVPVALGLLAPFAGVLTDRIGSRGPTVVGMGLAASALLALALVPHPPLMGVLVGLAVLGGGLGLFTPPNNSAVMASAPSHRLGVAGGILNMTRSLGTSFGVAAAGAVLSIRLAAHAGATVHGTLEAPIPVLEVGFRESLLFLVGLAVLAGAISAARGGKSTGTDDTARRLALAESAA